MATTMSPAASTSYHIEIPPASTAEDDALVDHLTKLINDVYLVAEEGIFYEGQRRTNMADVTSFLQQQLALASKSSTSPYSPPTNIVGYIRILKNPPELGGWGMLVASPETRGSGLGTRLVEFAEERCLAWGVSKIQIELLVPTTYELKLKTWIQAWYQRLGYDLKSKADIATYYPKLAPLICTPVDFRVFEKSVRVQG